MIITIDLDNLKDLNIAQYSFLCIYYKSSLEDAKSVSGISKHDLADIQTKNYLTIDNILTNKATSLFNELPRIFIPDEDISAFVESYRAIFPSGNNSSGYPYKGDKQGCIKKMKKFLKTYPNFTKQQILKAARSYVTTHFFKGYTYMQTAAYLIEKDGISNLAGLCETIDVKNNTPDRGSMERDLN